MTMITFSDAGRRFNMRVVGVVLHEDHVLLGSYDDSSHWVLPGGRAELLETSRESVAREMFEELGQTVQVRDLYWIVENFFLLNGEHFHELGMYYRIDLPAASPLLQRDSTHEVFDGGSQWSFRWHALERLHELEIRPPFLHHGLLHLPGTPQHIVIRYPHELNAGAVSHAVPHAPVVSRHSTDDPEK